jgi:beta-galactosidase
MKVTFACALLLWGFELIAAAGTAESRERLRLDFGWRFATGDVRTPGSDFGFDRDRPETATGPARPDFDDHTWRAVDVPHDYVVEGGFDRKADLSHGYLPAGVGWYRRTFSLGEADRGRSLWVDFDGVFRDSLVWLNGHFLGRHESGYTGFHYDLGTAARFGGTNVLVVRTDASKFEGWWYEGGGIYRHVWLNKAGPLHVEPWGVFVTANVTGPLPASESSATITIQTTLTNAGDAGAAFRVQSEIQTDRGAAAVAVETGGTAPARGQQTISQTLALSRARLWSVESPALYRVVTIIERDGAPVDRVVTPFGIRDLRFDATKGFLLNGRPVKLKGTCNHQDFAGTGVAMPDRLVVFRLEKLKEMGANAYRCSHNPPAPELLEACDRLGILVMDENRRLGDSPEILGQLASLVRRDRNHPSVILWSLCNEEEEQGSAKGERIGRTMKDLIRQLDPTRPVTAAMNGGYGAGLSHVVDVLGFNYHSGEYAKYHQAHPEQPLFGSETASTVSTRGIYENDKTRGYVSAYDVNFPPWAATAETAWRPLAEHPYLAGGFVWTGFDYKGEPTPYEWPCINSHFGILDLCGFPKDNFYYYQSWWTDRPVLHLLPHWNWPGKEGREIEVWCHSNCDAMELFLNGRSLGRQVMPRNSHLVWQVRYAPGVLSARGFRGNKAVATAKVETTGAPAALRLTPDRAAIAADGQDVSLVTVAVVDQRGRVVPVADNQVTFELAGRGRLLGVGNGDPSSHEPDKAAQRKAFNGLGLALVQSTRTRGRVRLTARSPGLRPATVVLETRNGAFPPID